MRLPAAPVTKAASPANPRLALLHNEQPPEAAPVEPPAPVASTPPVSAPPPVSSCPGEMVLVEGEYCTVVEQTCIDWMEQPTPGGVGRCRKFAPSVCKGERVHKKFCMDKDEYTAAGETLPMGSTSWTKAKETCEADGKRLCQETEWNFACEGEEMLPYPIGYERDATKCNFDQMKLLDNWGKPRDLRKSPAETAQCVSPFGIRNMSGNVDEWTMRDVTYGQWRTAMKGGWWMAARNRCRPATTAHDEQYRDFQTGFRCCADSR